MSVAFYRCVSIVCHKLATCLYLMMFILQASHMHAQLIAGNCLKEVECVFDYNYKTWRNIDLCPILILVCHEQSSVLAS